MKTKRQCAKVFRKIAIEVLEARNLLTIFSGAHAGMGALEITLDPTAGQTTWEHQDSVGGNAPPAIPILIRLKPGLAANTAPVTVNLSTTPGGEGQFSPAAVTFVTGEVNVYKTVILKGMDDADVDDGHIPFTANFLTTSADTLFNNIGGSDGSFTNRDDDLKANPDIDISVPEMEIDEPGERQIQVKSNDTDAGGDGSWGFHTWALAVGQGEVSHANETGGWLAFRPTSDWYGNFVISYTMINEWNKVSTTTASGVVTNVPDPPVADSDDAGTMAEETVVVVFPLANDHDRDNPPINKPANDGLKVASIGQVIGGQAIVSWGEQGIEFTP